MFLIKLILLTRRKKNSLTFSVFIQERFCARRWYGFSRGSYINLQELLELGDNGVTNLGGGVGATKVTSADAGVQNRLDGLLHKGGLLGELQTEAQHHGGTEDGSDGVDLVLGQIGSGTVAGLVKTKGLVCVGERGEGGTGQETQGTGNDGSLVRENVTKHVGGDEDTIEGRGVLDHDHGSRVNELVVKGELGELLLHGLGDSLAPKTGRGKNVGLVKGPNGQRRVRLEGQESGHAGEALDLGDAVELSVPGLAGTVVLCSLTKVDASNEFSDNGKIGALDDTALQGTKFQKVLRDEVAWSQVGVKVELLSNLEKTLLRANSASSPLGTTNGSQKDSVGSLGGVEGLVRQGVAGSVNGSATNEVLLEVKGDVGAGLSNGLEDLDGLVGALGTDVVTGQNDNLLVDGGHYEL